MAKSCTAKISLAGGMTIHAKSLTLYDENGILKAASLWQDADKKLGATSGVGVGFMGSPSFVLGALVAASAFTRWHNDRVGRESSELREAAKDIYRKTLDAGREFDWGDLENGEWPDPSRWQAMAFENLRRNIFVPKPEGELQIRTVDSRLIWLMWGQVSTYEIIEQEEAS